MTLYLETPEGFVPWGGQPIAGILHPRDIEQKWTPDELAAVGLYAPTEYPPPEGKRVTGKTVIRDDDGEVTFLYDLEDIPPPHPRDRDLTKRQLRLILYGNGFARTFVGDVIDAIEDPTEKDIALIWWEDSPTISWDNPMTQKLMQASGLDEDACKSMWMAGWDLEE